MQGTRIARTLQEAVMTEIDQLHAMLGPSAYWDDERPGTSRMEMANGLKLQVTDDCRWEAVWADGSKAASKKAFATALEAKDDLKKAMRKRLEKLAYDATPPARMDL